MPRIPNVGKISNMKHSGAGFSEEGLVDTRKVEISELSGQ